MISIGYVEKGKAEFVSSLSAVTKEALGLGVAMASAAASVVAAVTLIAQSLEGLYFASQRTGASVENINAFSFAVSRMGGTAGEARNVLESMGRFLRTNPGSEGFIQSLGVATRDTKGQLRDTSAMIVDLGAKLKAMPFYQAQAYGNVLGIDEKTLIALRGDLGEFSDQYKAMLKAASFDSQQAAKDSHLFMNQVSLLGAAFSILKDKVGSVLARDMTDGIRTFREWLVSNFETISRTIAWVSAKLVEAGDIVSRMADRAGQAARAIGEWWGGLDSDSKGLIKTFAAVAAGLAVLNAVIAASPLVRLSSLGAALAAW